MKKTIKTFILMLMMTTLFVVGAYASGELSDEPAAQATQEATEQTSKTTIIYGGQTYVLDVYEIDGVKYVKLADAQEILTNNDIDALDASAEPVAEDEAASGEPSGEPSDEPMDGDDGLASGEPSGEMVGEASGEPSGEPVDSDDGAASGEPSGEMGAQGEASSFDVTFRVNGEEYQTAAVGVALDGNTYTFQISDLLEALGLSLEYDEEADVAYLSAKTDGLLAALLGQTVTKVDVAEEPVAQEAAEPEAAPVETAAEQSDAVPATDGTENQQNVLESTAVPETEEQFDAYKEYLVQFMNDYTGLGDGTFDDGARDMALSELSGVSFGADVNAFPFEMFVSQFGALDYGGFLQAGA
jgi:cell division septation protein DedD